MSNKRIANNTLMLYFRQILILFVSLYTVRIVLDILGVEDYGLYNVVAGIVTFFSFLSGTMASATQRFFSFALGGGDLDRLKKVFSVNIIIYISIAILAIVLLESFGLWFVKSQLKIPLDRMNAVLFLYHFSIATFFVSIFTAPFLAIIIAHEEMQIYAYVSILEALLKLGVVFLLTYINYDKLQLYGALVFFVAIINASVYISVCLNRYQECQFKTLFWDKSLFKELVGFTGWTLFGQITTVMRGQAITILINQFFNPATVAARAIANNISSQVNLFSNNFNVGLYPPIIKSYASEDKETMFSLIFNGSKITFFLLWVFALPLFICMEIVLGFWLKDPPADSILFTRLALCEVVINSISLPIITAARAPGKMKSYELTLGFIQLLILPICLLILRMGYSASSVYITTIIVNICMFFIRLVIVKKLIGISLLSFFTFVVRPVLLIMLISSILPFLILNSSTSELATVVSAILGILLACFSMYFFGLSKDWKYKVLYIIKSKI